MTIRKLQFLLLTAFIILGAMPAVQAQRSGILSLQDAYGKVENGVYSNANFNFSMTAPVDWYIQEPDMSAEVEATANDIFADEKLFVMFLKKTFGQPQNAVMTLSCQKAPTDAATLALMAAKTRKTLLAEPKAPVISVPKNTLAGTVKGITLDVGRGQTKQRLYFFENKGFYFNFALTYYTAADLAVMETALKTLKFK